MITLRRCQSTDRSGKRKEETRRGDKGRGESKERRGITTNRADTTRRK